MHPFVDHFWVFNAHFQLKICGGNCKTKRFPTEKEKKRVKNRTKKNDHAASDVVFFWAMLSVAGFPPLRAASSGQNRRRAHALHAPLVHLFLGEICRVKGIPPSIFTPFLSTCLSKQKKNTMEKYHRAIWVFWMNSSTQARHMPWTRLSLITICGLHDILNWMDIGSFEAEAEATCFVFFWGVIWANGGKNSGFKLHVLKKYVRGSVVPQKMGIIQFSQTCIKARTKFQHCKT